MDEEVKREVVEETQEEVIEHLEKLYEDDEIVVLAAPDDAELERLILNILKEKRMKFKELKEAFSATAGEDRLRRALLKLMEEGRVYELPDGSYTANIEDLEAFREAALPEAVEAADEFEEAIEEIEEENEEFEDFEDIEDIEDLDEL
ncbi:hypothetical protein IPA_04780 [Ignicoccus pacificus DSM 13166]|uniref:Uncharacterized protein n=1 Tax=Ignicoccus pacificus DSM 13166 TaxID=940294 RepID=A0A977K9H3_9CREN|nr:hypothetical protein IPA_04780 [Ignicoccus pacificus DSM 13166]